MLHRLVFGLILFFSAPAFADMDYACLANCKNKGSITQVCMQQCVYSPPVAAFAVGKGIGNTHKEFVAPVSVGSQVVSVQPHYSSSYAPSTIARSVTGSKVEKSAQCVQLCMQQKMQYSLCQARCAEPN